MAGSIADLENEEEFSEAHEINVTPFIDVMLVLLIIFMVAAPLSTVDMNLDLPSSTATPQKKPDKPTLVSIQRDLSVMIDEKPVKRIDLTKELAALYRDGKDHRIDIGAERSVPYGELYDILDRLRQGGYRKVNLIAYEGGADSNRPAAADLTLPNSMPAVPQQ